MDLFDVHRRDVYNFDQYMDLKKPGFGGNDSLEYARDAQGKEIKKNNNENKLKGYRRTVERSPMFKHQHYNSTYKAMTNDLVYKQEGKEPTKYADPYLTGVATVEVGEYETNESILPTFNSFINENKIEGEVKATVELNKTVEDELKRNEKLLSELKKQEKDALTEGKCVCKFNNFNLDENWFEEEYDVLDSEVEEAPVETEEEVTAPPKRRFTPTRPPRREVDPNPKNKLDSAVEDLSDYLKISKEEAARILGVAIINDLQNKQEDELGAGPSCGDSYGAGPSCGK